VIHETAEDAAHVQSRSAVIVTVPDPPAAGAVSRELARPTWHFDDVGAVSATSVAEVHPAAASAADKTTIEVSRIRRDVNRIESEYGPAIGASA
jgi:hypothetical protein